MRDMYRWMGDRSWAGWLAFALVGITPFKPVFMVVPEILFVDNKCKEKKRSYILCKFYFNMILLRYIGNQITCHVTKYFVYSIFTKCIHSLVYLTDIFYHFQPQMPKKRVVSTPRSAVETRRGFQTPGSQSKIKKKLDYVISYVLVL